MHLTNTSAQSELRNGNSTNSIGGMGPYKDPVGDHLSGTLVQIDTKPLIPNIIRSIAEQGKAGSILDEIWALRRTTYNRIYPEVSVFEGDPYDRHSCVLYTHCGSGSVDSTARIAMDGPASIPEQVLIPDVVSQLRDNGKTFAELGRFVIEDSARGVLKNYFRTFYACALSANIDVYVMFVRQRWISFYQKFMDAQIVASLDEVTFGSNSSYVCMTWEIERTTSRFIRWSGCQDHDALSVPSLGHGDTE